MGLEATSWSWLRDGVQKTLPAFSLLERVENGVVVGMPDVNYVIRGVEGWIELKAVPLPARDSTAVLGAEGLNIDQINWALKRVSVNGRVFTFISAAPYRWLVDGVHARTVNQWTRDELCMKARYWYDDKWDASCWRRLINALTS